MQIAPASKRLGRRLESLQAGHAFIGAQIDALEDLSGHVVRHGSDEHAREEAAKLMRNFDGWAVGQLRGEEDALFPLLRSQAEGRGRHEAMVAIGQAELDYAVLCDLYSVVRNKLRHVADGTSDRLDTEWVGRFAWLCRRHMISQATLVLPFAAETVDEG
jgi:pyridoxamine 5'-phosphate oxidase